MSGIRQEIEAIYRARRIKKCAAAMGVAESTAYRYQQPTDKNGETIPLLNLMALNDDVRENGNADALRAAYRLANHIVGSLGAVAVDREMLQAMLNGIPLRALTAPKEATEICQKCDEPVRYLPVCNCRWSRT